MARNKEERKIMLRYPYDASGKNDMYDGEYHSIIPSSLYRFVVADRDFYLLHYYDENYGCPCITLLTVCNGMLCKVPLDSYEELDTLLDNVRIFNVSCDALPDKISLAQMLSLNSLIYCAKTKTDKLELKNYFPYNIKNFMDIKNRVFSGSGLVIGAASKVQHYHYDKVPTHPLFVSALKKELMNNYEKLVNNDSFEIEFSVNIPNGMFSEVVTDDKILQMHLIPGIHHYTMFVTPNFVHDDVSIKNCLAIEIDALTSKYDGLHDQNKVFKDGFVGALPVEFKMVDYVNKHKK